MAADIIVGIILFIVAVFYARRGFMLTVFSMVQWIVGIVISLFICTPVAGLITEKTEITKVFRDFFVEFIRKRGGVDEVCQGNDLLLAMDDHITGTLGGVAEHFAEISVRMLTFIVLLVVLKLIGTFILRSLRERRRRKHGFTAFLDSIGGLVAGVCVGLVIIFLVSTILMHTMVLFPEGVQEAVNDSFEQSFFAAKVCSINPFSLLFNMLFK